MPTIAERIETATAALEAATGAQSLALAAAEASAAASAASAAEAAATAAGLVGGLSSRVAFPATTASPGAAGEFSQDPATGELAIYLAGTGWLFYAGYGK